jgi:phosphoglycerate dehydrogenase-like enzyme
VSRRSNPTSARELPTLAALIPDTPLRCHLEPLPAGVRLVEEPSPDVAFLLVDGQPADRLDSLFAELTGLRVAQTFAAGVEWLLPYVPRQVLLCNGSGIHDTAVAEWAVAALLSLQRRLPEFHDLQRRGSWDRSVGPIDDLEDKTVLILGYGAIGRAVEARLEPFGVKLLRVARQKRDGVATPDLLPSLLAESDAVVVLLPLTPETEGLIDAEFLAHLKPGALLVNAGRGRVVRTDALIRAARAGRVRAALDVTDPEPLPSGHPLWRTPNVIVTPHIAGATEQWEARAYKFLREQLRRCASGEQLLNDQSRYRTGPSV